MKISLVAAVTSDGFIGREKNDRSFDWTSKEDSRFYVDTIKKSDTIIMGAQTFRGIKLHPRGSHYVIYSRSPEEFVNPRPEVITAEATKDDPEKLLRRLKDEGFKNVVVAGGASIYKLFLESGLIETLYVVKEPVNFGDGILLFNDIALEEATKNYVLDNEKKLNDGGTVLQEWVIRNKKEI
jgi:dihydrofolate reductase